MYNTCPVLEKLEMNSKQQFSIELQGTEYWNLQSKDFSSAFMQLNDHNK